MGVTSRGKARCDSLKVVCYAAAILRQKRELRKVRRWSVSVSRKQSYGRGYLITPTSLRLGSLLIGVRFTATYLALSRDDHVDYAYVLFLASLLVVLLDQLWKIKL